MDPESILNQCQQPTVVLLQATFKSAEFLLSKALGGKWPYLSFRQLRGRKMDTKVQLIDEFIGALQLPLWVEDNWDWLHSSLWYMDSIPHDPFLFIIYDSQEILLKEPDKDQFRVFLEILDSVGTSWNKGVPKLPEHKDEQTYPVPFHVLFQCLPDHINSLRARFQATGVSFSEISFLEEEVYED